MVIIFDYYYCFQNFPKWAYFWEGDCLLQVKLPMPALISLTTFCPSILWAEKTFNEKQPFCSLGFSLPPLFFIILFPRLLIQLLGILSISFVLTFASLLTSASILLKVSLLKYCRTSGGMGFTQCLPVFCHYYRIFEAIRLQRKGFILAHGLEGCKPQSGDLVTLGLWQVHMTEETIHFKTQGTKNKRKTVDSKVLGKHCLHSPKDLQRGPTSQRVDHFPLLTHGCAY